MTDFLNLMATVSKDQNLLREGDLNFQDKTNYERIHNIKLTGPK